MPNTNQKGGGTEEVLVRQSRLHPKLYIGVGNVYDLEKFGADAVVALVSKGFSMTWPTYSKFLHSHPDALHADYIYNTKPQQSDFNSIVHPLIDELASKGARVITVSPLHCSDVVGSINKDIAMANTLVSWLETHPSDVDKIILVDLSSTGDCCYRCENI